VRSRTENSGGQFWKRLSLTEDCNARRRKRHSDGRLTRMALCSSCGTHSHSAHSVSLTRLINWSVIIIPVVWLVLYINNIYIDFRLGRSSSVSYHTQH